MKHQKPAEIFRRNLDELMKRTGMKYSDIARAARLDSSTIRRIHLGERKPGVDTAEEIANAFGLTGWQMLLPDLLAGVDHAGKLDTLIARYLHASLDGQEYIDRVAEKESTYTSK